MRSQTTPGRYGADQGFVFAVAAVLRPGESLFRGESVGATWPESKKFGRKSGTRAAYSIVDDAEAGAQVAFFVAHDRVIKNREINDHQAAGPPGMSGDGKSDGEKCAAEIERIARARVRTGGGQFPIFAQVPGSDGANDEAEARRCHRRGRSSAPWAWRAAR